LTRESNLIAAVFLGLIAVCATGFGAPCRETNEIISNNMRLLAGSGDTVWVASLGSQGWGVNYTLNRGEKWQGYSLGCLESGIAAIVFGRGMLLAIQGTGTDKTRSPVWTYSHDGPTISSFEIKWHDSTMTDDSIATDAVGAVYAGGRFYFACWNGGVAFWDPQSKVIRASLPGDSVPFDPGESFRALHPLFGSNKTIVSSVDRFAPASGTRILAVTEPKLWLCDTTGRNWDDTSITSVFADSALVFKGYEYAFVNNSASGAHDPLLYASIRYTQKPGIDTLVSLFRYRFGERRWTLALKETPRAIAPAVRGFLYAVTGANQIAAYRDSLADTAMLPAAGLTVRLTDNDLFRRLTETRSLIKPDSIQSLLFVKTSDSAGNFFIAASGGNFSSDGLYSSYREIPGVTTDTFRLDRYAKEIKNSLGETYAKPGILSDQYPVTTFIYRLGREARVTLKIYDYNMQHVKTIINNEIRKAKPSGRSNEDRDAWDATTAYGKPVAPGMYYYRITASTGERAFGKIVVAKGRTE
jgi:hypothetical protein